MPIFSSVFPNARAVTVGDNFALFAAADTLTGGSTSPVLTVSGPQPGQAIQFTFNFASAPIAVVELFGSNTAPTVAGPQNGILVYTSTNMLQDSYLDTNGFAFYWAQLVSQSAGGALNLTSYVQSGSQGAQLIGALNQIIAQATVANLIAAQNSTVAPVTNATTNVTATLNTQ